MVIAYVPYYAACESDNNKRRQHYRVFLQAIGIVYHDHHQDKQHISQYQSSPVHINIIYR
jgi:hypothetical protein